MTNKRRPLLNESGAVTSSTMIWLFFITVIIYVAYMVLPPYFSYYMLKTEVKEEAQLAHKFTDSALVDNISSKAYLWNVPITLDDIIVTRGGESISINIDYAEQVDFLFSYTKIFYFEIAVNEPLKDDSDLLQ
ncbi:MAG: hypothetical protein IME99_09255 [Proteobacteria bacterium]|nr:hypothetical protein [Pseudomonadota bacterium]